MSTDRRARAWMEVDASALRRNYGRIREAVGPEPALIPMVKADGYGTGISGVVRCLEGVEPWGYGVATVEEGQALRALGVRRPILVIAPVPYETLLEAAEADLTLALSDVEAVRRLARVAVETGRRASFHVEVDTGMGRAGLDWRSAKAWGAEVASLADGPLRWEGCFTHFHSAELEEDASLRAQWGRLEDALRLLPGGGGGLMVHACNSAGALRARDLAAAAVRPGIFLYGGASGHGLPAPEPVVAVRARIVLVRDVPAGTTVGYGATHAAAGPERWATVAIGYGDGLPRALGNRGHALVAGRRAPIIGRISMDMTVVDITRAGDAEPGDVATFIGRDGDDALSLEEMATHASTINYEILTGFTPRLPRVWIDAGGG